MGWYANWGSCIKKIGRQPGRIVAIPQAAGRGRGAQACSGGRAGIRPKLLHSMGRGLKGRGPVRIVQRSGWEHHRPALKQRIEQRVMWKKPNTDALQKGRFSVTWRKRRSHQAMGGMMPSCHSIFLWASGTRSPGTRPAEKYSRATGMIG